MTTGYFSPTKRGGIETSNVEHQDAVATILCVELLSGTGTYSQQLGFHDDWKVMAEGNDDLELISDRCRVFVQVKKEVVTQKVLEEIIQNFRDTRSNLGHQGVTVPILFRIQALNGLGSNIKILETKIEELRNSRSAYSQAEYNSHLQELCESYNLAPNVIPDLTIDTRRLFRDSSDAFALFCLYFRRAYPIRHYGDNLLSAVYRELMDEVFAPARRNRSPVEKKEITERIYGLITPLNNLTIETGYVKTDKGYERDKDLERFLASEEKLLKIAISKIRRDWVRYYAFTAVKNLFLGAWEQCPSCGHPMMANFSGLLGLACPDCGYCPFATLMLVCDCGKYSIIKRQPLLSTEDCAEYIAAYIRNGPVKCQNCGKILPPEVIRRRWLVVPFPIPVSEYQPGKSGKYVEHYHNA